MGAYRNAFASEREHARHVIEIIEAGYRAAEAGRRQELTTRFTVPPTTLPPD